MANPDRKGGGGLSLQTLVVASAASLTAAMVSSRLFPPGTVYASALTPVIVAAVSEALNRPAAKAGELARQRRMVVSEARRRQTQRVVGGEQSPLRGAPEFAQGPAAAEELGANGDAGHADPGRPPEMRIHGTRRWGRIHPKVAIATGLAAFAIAAAVLTLPELLFGGAVATTHRTTFFGGGSTQKQQHTTTTTQTGTTTTPKTVTKTATVPAQTAPQATQTETTTTPTDTATQTTPAPAETQTTPADTNTSTTPAAPGAVP